MTPRRGLAFAAAVLVAAAAGGMRLGRRAPGPAPDPKVLSSFEELVLMRLDGLRGSPLAGGFLSELKERPDLRRYLEGGEDPRLLDGFRGLVRRYQDDPGFRDAVEKAEFAGAAVSRKIPPKPAAIGPRSPKTPAEPAPCGPTEPGKQPEPAALDAAGPKCGAEPAPDPLSPPAAP